MNSIFKCLALGAGVGAAIYIVMGRRSQQGMSDIDSLVDRSKLSSELAALLSKAEVASVRVVGMNEAEAVRLLKSNGLVPRLAWRAEWPADFRYALTADLNIGRVNYEVKNGAVTKAWVT